MNLDAETVASLARGHESMWPRHRTRPVRNGMMRVVGYLCHGVSDSNPCDVDWFMPIERGTDPIGGAS